MEEVETQIASLIRKSPGPRVVRQIHSHILTCFLPKSTLSFLLSKILDFSALSSHGDIGYARKVFKQIQNPDTFSYNSIIRCFAISNVPSKEPIFSYKRMVQRGYPKANTFTVAFVLKVCSVLVAFEEGIQVHARALRCGFVSNPFVQSSLLNFCAKCEEIGLARKMFDEITERNVVLWSVMISGYARVGMGNEALGMFREMQKGDFIPDEVALVSVVSVCAVAGALDIGRWIHAYIKKQMIRCDIELNTALVNIYTKCGCLETAKEFFYGMTVKDSKAWSSMIVVLAIHGHAEDALQLFSDMQEAKARPNHVTFIGLLLACAHGGLVSEGRKFWSSMLELGIVPSVEHYGCMVDLLCGGGLFDEAYSFVQKMPISPNPGIFRTLLLGSRKNQMFEQAETIVEQLVELEPLNAENYTMVANFYASYCQWERMSMVRKKMKERGIKAVPGCSSIEIDGSVHEFVMGDWSHTEEEDIRNVLKDISTQVHNYGHEPHLSAVLHNVVDEEKQEASSEHSERLAIAYGLLKTKPPAAIRIVKNLRVCTDCHEVTKIISKIYNREILVRDRIRFHKFVNGTCSCQNYW